MKLFYLFITLVLYYKIPAQVIYNDITDISTTMTPQNTGSNILPIDFNNDGIIEYNFRWDYFGGHWFLHMTFSNNNNNKIALKTLPLTYPVMLKPLNLDASIDSSLIWGNSYPEPFIGTSVSDSNFQNIGDAYIGVQFKIGSNTHYGWVLVSFSNMTLTIKSYAYQSIPNTPIFAGQQFLSAVNNTLKNKSLHIYQDSIQNNAFNIIDDVSKIKNVAIFDLEGKLIENIGKINSRNYKVYLNNNGIYIFKIITEKDTITKKVIKKK